jgi:hypothetical protein
MLSTQAPKTYKSVSQRDLNEKSEFNNKSQINNQGEFNNQGELKNTANLQQTINVVNINKNDSNSLIIIHDKDSHKFIIKDNDNVLGHFTVGQIFKFINSDIEGYLLDVDLGISVELIKRYLLNVDNLNVSLVSHLNSPITGSIELLVKLYKDIQSFEEKLNIEYENLSENTKNLVKLKNKNFIYGILIHIIKLFATYTTTNKKLSEETKNMITSYSIGATYKINSMIKDDLDSNLNKIISLNNDLQNLKQIRENMTIQMIKLSKSVVLQNDKIDLLIMNLNSQNGGANDSSITNTSSINSSSIISTNTTSDTTLTNSQPYSQSNVYQSSYISSTPNSEVLEIETLSTTPTSITPFTTFTQSALNVVDSETNTDILTLKGKKNNKTQSITNSISSFLSS